LRRLAQHRQSGAPWRAFDNRSMDEVFGLFPIPFLRAPGTLDAGLVERLRKHFEALAQELNKASPKLSHTEILSPTDSPLYLEAAALITPKIVDMGALMFGERLEWSIKEMWVNVLDAGGQQSMHNHANSFVSGVVYLTPTHPDSQTVFLRNVGSTDFVFKNENDRVSPTPFNADRWVSPAPKPGDLVLFPSYLLHTVPPNPGERRISMAFNAMPSSLDSWGYSIRFGA
jgi:hypothetical protein